MRDEVSQLNAWGIWAYGEIERLQHEVAWLVSELQKRISRDCAIDEVDELMDCIHSDHTFEDLDKHTPADMQTTTAIAATIEELQAKLDAANARVAEIEQTFSLMAMLRGNDWCVVLKCLPASMNWIIEGSRSEYDAPSPDIKLGEGKWCCELSCMRMMKGDGLSGYRVPVCTMHESPYEAVRLAYERATQ